MSNLSSHANLVIHYNIKQYTHFHLFYIADEASNVGSIVGGVLAALIAVASVVVIAVILVILLIMK